jgi:hypothetical protein
VPALRQRHLQVVDRKAAGRSTERNIQRKVKETMVEQLREYHRLVEGLRQKR